MKSRRCTVALVMCLGLLLWGPFVSAQQEQEGYTGKMADRKKVCMIQDNIQTKEGIPYQYEGKTYYLCCPMCVEGFKREPARYSKAVDPVSGKLVDKGSALIYAHKGRAYFFASEDNLSAFAKEPERYLTGSQMH